MKPRAKSPQPSCSHPGSLAASLPWRLRPILFLLLALCCALPAQAQSSCASDGQPVPTALLERFIDADCESCWRQPPATATDMTSLSIDWITPGERGDEATLSAAATRDALARLAHLGLKAPAQEMNHQTRVESPRTGLRVAHGLAVNDYIGVSIEFRLPRQRKPPSGPLSAWLLLVETLPAGSEGSPIARNMVRNTFQPLWNMSRKLSKKERLVFQEFRPMRIPPGARPERLRVVGWVEDAQGQIIAAAQSRCTEVPP